MYQNKVARLVNEVSNDLRFSALSYYKIGLEIFHESRTKNWVDFQPAIGNLVTSIELVLKSVVAKKAIRMLYTDIPDEVQLLLCYPESLSKDFNSRAYLGDLKRFEYKTIKLNKCISLFYHFFPNSKKEYKQFFSSLSTVRNISIHAAVPDIQRYELERIAYFATNLFQLISDTKVFPYFTIKNEQATEQFIKNYKDEKIKKVKDSLEIARINVKRGLLVDSEIDFDDWNIMEIECPICENSAIVYGETEASDDEDGLNLNFLCDSFLCKSCGLDLGDYEELELAGLETSLERNDDIEKWIEEFGNQYDDEWW